MFGMAFLLWCVWVYFKVYCFNWLAHYCSISVTWLVWCRKWRRVSALVACNPWENGGCVAGTWCHRTLRVHVSDGANWDGVPVFVVSLSFFHGRESGCGQVSGLDSLSLTFGVSVGELVRWVWVRDGLVLLWFFVVFSPFVSCCCRGVVLGLWGSHWLIIVCFVWTLVSV